MMKIFWVVALWTTCQLFSLSQAQQWTIVGCFDSEVLPTGRFAGGLDEDNPLSVCQSTCLRESYTFSGITGANCFCWDALGTNTYVIDCEGDGLRYDAYSTDATCCGAGGGECEPACGDICDDTQTCQCADDYTLNTDDQSCYSTSAESVQPPATSVFTVFGDPHVTVTDPTNGNRFCFDIRETQSETLNILENEAVDLSITGDLESCGNNMSCLKSVNIVLGDAEIEFTDDGIVSNGDASYDWNDFTSYKYRGIEVQSTTGDLGKQKLVTLAVSDTASVQLTVSSMSMAASLQFMGIILHNQDGLEAVDTDGALGQFLGVEFSVSGDELTFSPALDQGSGISSVAIVTSNRYDPVSHERPNCYTYNGDDSHDLIQDDLS